MKQEEASVEVLQSYGLVQEASLKTDQEYSLKNLWLCQKMSKKFS